VIYLDTAYLAKTYLNEPGSEVVRDYLKSTREVVASSSLARAELAAVFHRNLREGRLGAGSYELILKQYQTDLRSNLWEWLPIEERFFGVIETSFSELGTSVFLRGADAIHLVTAKAHGFSELFTNDRHLLAACDAFGLKGRNILS
jgi:predicted nucleic acid-binding protein